MMKWLVIGGEFNELRYRCLSEFLSRNGIENQLELWRPAEEDFPTELETAKNSFDQIRIERPFSSKVVAQSTHQSSLARSVGAADALVKNEGGWWPQNILYEGLTRLAAARFHNLDLTASVFIVGTGSAARAAVAAFSKLGFQRINITDRYAEKLQKFVQELRRNFFKVNLEYTTLENLTLLPGNHQVVVNTTPLTESNTLLEELYYFNYMRSEGIVIDFTLVPVRTPLLQEAESVKAEAVPGYLVAAWSDIVWLEGILKRTFDVAEYAELLHEKLSRVEFDLQPFVDKLK